MDVCKVSVSPEVMMGHNAGLEIVDSVYPFSRTDIRTFNIAEGNFGINLEDMWQGEVPSRLVVGLVKSQAYRGDYNLNPYHFDHFDVSTIGFFVNGESTPRPSFKLDLENGIYLQGLNSLYKITGKTMENSDIGITRETYRQGYTLIGFDVDPTTSPDFRYVGKPREGHTKEGHSCENAISELVGEILKNKENNKFTVSLFLDLSKAFDSLKHSTLLDKMEIYGIRGSAYSWFSSYLNQRQLRAKCRTGTGNSEVSRNYDIVYGTPQCSCLGPLLFIIFCNDLKLHLTYLSCIQFADDSTLYASGKSLRLIEC